MKEKFYEIGEKLIQEIQGDEVLLLNFFGTDLSSVRFNKGKFRQPGKVEKNQLNIELISGQKSASFCFYLTGDDTEDIAQCKKELSNLRETIPFLPENPYLFYSKEVNNTENIQGEGDIDSHTIMAKAIELFEGTDAVGFYCGGKSYVGFMNSLGQKNWDEKNRFNFDFSLYLNADKAAKSSYGGSVFEADKLKAKIERAKEIVEILKLPTKTIEPGKYRAYITPSALSDYLDWIRYQGFMHKLYENKKSPLQKLASGEKKLSPKVSITENNVNSVVPLFDGYGFIKPKETPLVKNGEFQQFLVSRQSAKEFGLKGSNTTADYETLLSTVIEGGDLKEEDIFAKIGTGLYISNMWYTNFSDSQNCKITGMTRFATLWIEDGKPVAPVNVMRFDETIYNVFGDELEELSAAEELLPTSPDSYGAEFYSKIPGLLLKKFSLTL